MAIKVAAWNVADGFSREAYIDPIVGEADSFDADVVIFSEAYAEDRDTHIEAVREKFASRGYTESAHCLYEDNDDRRDRHGMLAISRLAGQLVVARMSTRNALRLTPIDDETHIPLQLFGIHLDDRNDYRRIDQAETLLEQVDMYQPRAIAGDFNAMHGGDLWARALRASGVLWNHVPATDINALRPDSGLGMVGYKIGRTIDQGRRVSRMASGKVMACFESAGLRDIDEYHQPTHRGGQIDHIMVSSDVEATDFRIHECRNLSDHSAISAVLRT